MLGWLRGRANTNARTIYGRADVRVAPGREETRGSVDAMSDPSPVREEEGDADLRARFVSETERRKEAGCCRWRSRADTAWLLVFGSA